MGEMRIVVGVWGAQELNAALKRAQELHLTQEARAGDTRLIWDASQPAEVEAVKSMFDRLIRKHYNAYSVKADGEKGEMIHEFDPRAEKIILAPAIAGG